MKSGHSHEAQATAGRDAAIVARQVELFDDAPVPIGRWPSPESLVGRVLARLLDGRTITAGDWHGDAKSMRLAAEIRELRELGWRVSTVLRDVVTADCGRRARIAAYTLDACQQKAAMATVRGWLFVGAVKAFESGRRALVRAT